MALCYLLALLGLPLAAQFNASLQGTITDNTGSFVPTPTTATNNSVRASANNSVSSCQSTLILPLFRNRTAVTALGAAVERNEVDLQSAVRYSVIVRGQQIANCCFTQYAINGALHGNENEEKR